MIYNPLKINYLLAFTLFTLSLFACSSSSDSFTAKTYHNMTARYNAYFLARETMKEAEKELFDQRIENYNRVLDVQPYVDTNILAGVKDKMNRVIEKAALVPNRHENSEWVDDSYVLVGKARYYLRDFENALITFKYVNTKGEDQNARNQALVELLHTYLKMGEEREASAVLNYLKRRPMEDPEKLEFLLARGHFFREQNDMIETAKSLGSAVLIMPRGERKARVHFILGQIYQLLERDELAYKNYKAVFKNNPSYELSFYARLYLAQVSGLGDKKDIKKINRYFKKLLRDEKNEEYQDKIYYEMALFELRQEKIPETIAYLNESVAISENPIQKAYSYLKLGEIHYGRLQKFELAKVYYDSVMQNLPENVENYKAIKRRQKTLAEFVEQLTIYRTQDSLQRLAKIPEPQRREYIEKTLLLEETRRQDQMDSVAAARERRRKLKEQNSSSLAETVSDNSTWYFYNPNNITLGQQEFQKRWGRRPLEDNWRRSSKTVLSNQGNTEMPPQNIDPNYFRQQAIRGRVEKRTQEIYDALPETKEDFAASEQKIEDALYEVGKIYQLKLEEPENAAKYFDKLLSRFPRTDYEPEVLYFLYLIYQDLNNTAKADFYKNELAKRYPSSSYYKRIVNPNYLSEARANQAAVEAGYKKAYHAYKYDNLAEARQELQSIRSKYPETLIEDRLALLELLINIKASDKPADFKDDIDEFVENFPKSDLKEYILKIKEKL